MCCELLEYLLLYSHCEEEQVDCWSGGEVGTCALQSGAQGTEMIMRNSRIGMQILKNRTLNRMLQQWRNVRWFPFRIAKMRQSRFLDNLLLFQVVHFHHVLLHLCWVLHHLHVQVAKFLQWSKQKHKHKRRIEKTRGKRRKKFLYFVSTDLPH